MPIKLLFPELSYRIFNCAFKVHNELGGGLPEAVYQNAMQHAFELQNILFKEQQFSNVIYKGKKIKRNYSDFLVQEQVIVELKSAYRRIESDYRQVKKDLISSTNNWVSCSISAANSSPTKEY